MIPCHICGKDASTGWIKGFAPAHDSQKMALCAEHNTQDNRLAVAVAWQNMLRRDIALATSLARQRAESEPQVLSVHFTGGGMLSFTCVDCQATPHGSLRIEAADGSQTFIPLQHVREYVLRPLLESGVSETAPPGRADALSDFDGAAPVLSQALPDAAFNAAFDDDAPQKALSLPGSPLSLPSGSSPEPEAPPLAKGGGKGKDAGRKGFTLPEPPLSKP